ncbi:hypothetical protein EH105704_23_00090 [Atlantibacter hermannii NBRC 105704]|uniref:Uncharacterized protein n=1 Tax=Atlantibacter hermannii NBRC 105704 TaxID=1115512 RepID=H5V7D3_ATLHE|nr:hypothetical protein EH105704_23_00090 [Atlantibacter hermannii NBRC 105704]
MRLAHELALKASDKNLAYLTIDYIKSMVVKKVSFPATKLSLPCLTNVKKPVRLGITPPT